MRCRFRSSAERGAQLLGAALPETARAILTCDLAAALLAGNSAIKDREARDLLRPIAPWASDSPGYWRQRAIAHGRLGEVGAATLAHGEAALPRGRLKEAHDLAARARRQRAAESPLVHSAASQDGAPPLLSLIFVPPFWFNGLSG